MAPFASAVPIKMSVSGAEPERAAEIARWAMSKGLTALKVKVGIEPEGDMARVKSGARGRRSEFVRSASMRTAAGSAHRHSNDPPHWWRTSNIYFAEQPVAPLDVQWMADVRRWSPSR